MRGRMIAPPIGYFLERTLVSRIVLLSMLHLYTKTLLYYHYPGTTSLRCQHGQRHDHFF